MKTNLQKAQDFAIEQCLSDYPPRASYDKILELIDLGSRKVSVWEPLEYCDVAHIMDNMVSAVTRLLDAQTDPAYAAIDKMWDMKALDAQEVRT